VRGRSSQAPLVAGLVSGLAKYHDTVAIALVDIVLEYIHQGLEFGAMGQYQSRIAHVRLLGELYNYRVVSNLVVFDALHLLLSFADHMAATYTSRDSAVRCPFHYCNEPPTSHRGT
jgi:regulator of nonsense transcripts 2